MKAFVVKIVYAFENRRIGAEAFVPVHTKADSLPQRFLLVFGENVAEIVTS